MPMKFQHNQFINKSFQKVEMVSLILQAATVGWRLSILHIPSHVPIKNRTKMIRYGRRKAKFREEVRLQASPGKLKATMPIYPFLLSSFEKIVRICVKSLATTKFQSHKPSRMRVPKFISLLINFSVTLVKFLLQLLANAWPPPSPNNVLYFAISQILVGTLDQTATSFTLIPQTTNSLLLVRLQQW